MKVSLNEEFGPIYTDTSRIERMKKALNEEFGPIYKVKYDA
jgi:hypothetical protein